MRPWCQQAQGWWKHSDTGRQDVGSEGVCLDVTKGKHNLGHWENWGNLGLANGFPQDPATDHDIYESLWLRNQGAKVLRNHLSSLLRVQAGQQTIFLHPKFCLDESSLVYGGRISVAWYYQSLSKYKAGTMHSSFCTCQNIAGILKMTWEKGW